MVKGGIFCKTPLSDLISHHMISLLQSYSDLQPFTDLYRHPPGTAFDLTSAPVILHLQKDLSLLEVVEAAGDCMDNCDYKIVSIDIS